MGRHPETARITWLAAFVYLRGRSLIDDLVDLLIETIHHIGARAERKVERELLDDLRRVSGKQNLLFQVADHSGVTQKDLAYVRSRYLTVEALRRAVSIVTNGTLAVRNPAIWGDGTTACASDSKHFGAWDQNLTTQWHVRYGGRGVMIYWHVERNSLCIHYQLKSPSSSEVASMIEGVVHHCSEMEVDRQYVDSHGQRTAWFTSTR